MLYKDRDAACGGVSGPTVYFPHGSVILARLQNGRFVLLLILLREDSRRGEEGPPPRSYPPNKNKHTPRGKTKALLKFIAGLVRS